MGQRNSEDAPKTCSSSGAWYGGLGTSLSPRVVQTDWHTGPGRSIRQSARAADCQTKIRFFIQLVLGLWAGSFSNISQVWTELFLVRVIWFDMNLCALTMRTHANVKDDRPFSGPIRSYVAPFKGLKGQRNTASVTYRSNFFPDDLDDPELAFDNNNTLRKDCITPAPPAPANQ